MLRLWRRRHRQPVLQPLPDSGLWTLTVAITIAATALAVAPFAPPTAAAAIAAAAAADAAQSVAATAQLAAAIAAAALAKARERLSGPDNLGLCWQWEWVDQQGELL